MHQRRAELILALTVRLTVFVILLSSHSDALAQQSKPQPCPVSETAGTRPSPRSLELNAEARPSLVGPLLLAIAGPVVAFTSLAIGVENRPLCTDGCDRGPPTPYLVAAALSAGAALVGIGWLIERLIARAAYDRRNADDHTMLPRYDFELHVTPTIAHASLSMSF